MGPRGRPAQNAPHKKFKTIARRCESFHGPLRDRAARRAGAGGADTIMARILLEFVIRDRWTYEDQFIPELFARGA
jgi:hypothetical protein